MPVTPLPLLPVRTVTALRGLSRAAALVALCLALALPAAPARADLVIEGRAAQALHCAALMFMVSAELYDAGFISRREKETGQQAALVMLRHVPGTEAQRIEAMRLRFIRIMSSRSMRQWAEEWRSTSRWCMKNLVD